MGRGQRTRRTAIAIALAGSTAGLVAPFAGAAKDDLVLVSRQSTSDGGATADGHSKSAWISGDGRYLAFLSAADNLVSGESEAFDNVFLRDTQTGTTSLVNRQSTGDGGAAGDGECYYLSISADGRYVAFDSSDTNLSDVDGSDTDVFVRDTQTNTTTFVSRQSAGDGGAGSNRGASEPSISADGRYVAFGSYGTNLVEGENEDDSNIYLRDTQAETTTLISRQSAIDGGAGADDGAFQPSISADGRFVAFTSYANNLAVGENEAVLNVFLRDTQTDTTTLVSRQSASDGNTPGDAASSGSSLSADGRYVAFNSSADNFVTGEVESAYNVFVRDMQTDTTTLIGVQSASDGGAPADAGSVYPSISADGRHVAFESSSGNLALGEDETLSSVYVRDTQAQTTTLVSRQSASDGGAPAIGGAGRPRISADARYVAFQSMADNLSAIDSDGVQDVFTYELGGGSPPSTTDTTAPGLGASTAKARQKLGKALKVTVLSDEDAAVTATATAIPKGQRKRAKKLKFKSASAQATAGEPLKLKLKPSKKTARKLKAAAKAKAKITLSATDSADNTATDTLKVKLR